MTETISSCVPKNDSIQSSEMFVEEITVLSRSMSAVTTSLVFAVVIVVRQLRLPVARWIAAKMAVIQHEKNK